SARARAKVRHWFRYQHYEEDIAQGRIRLERELQRLGAVGVNQEKIAQRLRFGKQEDFLAALGRGDVGERQLGQAIQEEMPRVEAPQRLPAARPATADGRPPA